MTHAPSRYPRSARAPLHFWLAGMVILLFNCWGLLGSIMAQVHLVPEMPDEALAYLDRQPLWFTLVSELSPLAGVAGSLALLVQSRWAPRLFVLQLAVLLAANLYEVVLGISPVLTVASARLWTAFLVAVLTAQTLYARHMARRGLLS